MQNKLTGDEFIRAKESLEKARKYQGYLIFPEYLKEHKERLELNYPDQIILFSTSIPE